MAWDSVSADGPTRDILGHIQDIMVQAVFMITRILGLVGSRTKLVSGAGTNGGVTTSMTRITNPVTTNEVIKQIARPRMALRFNI